MNNTMFSLTILPFIFLYACFLILSRLILYLLDRYNKHPSEQTQDMNERPLTAKEAKDCGNCEYLCYHMNKKKYTCNARTCPAFYKMYQ